MNCQHNHLETVIFGTIADPVDGNRPMRRRITTARRMTQLLLVGDGTVSAGPWHFSLSVCLLETSLQNFNMAEVWDIDSLSRLASSRRQAAVELASQTWPWQPIVHFAAASAAAEEPDNVTGRLGLGGRHRLPVSLLCQVSPSLMCTLLQVECNSTE